MGRQIIMASMFKTMLTHYYCFSLTWAGRYIQLLWPELWQVINEIVTKSPIWDWEKSKSISKYSRQFYLKSRQLRSKKSDWARRCSRHRRWTSGPSKSKATRTLPWWHHWKRHAHTHTNTNTHTHMNSHTNMFVHALRHPQTCNTHTLTRTLTHTNTPIHPHTHTNTRTMTYSLVGPEFKPTPQTST